MGALSSGIRVLKAGVKRHLYRHLPYPLREAYESYRFSSRHAAQYRVSRDDKRVQPQLRDVRCAAADDEAYQAQRVHGFRFFQTPDRRDRPRSAMD